MNAFDHANHSYYDVSGIKGAHHSHSIVAGGNDLTVLCTAPSKTFNLAGLQVANIFISNPKLQKEFRKEMNRSGYSQLNIMGLVACQAAYQYGDNWLDQLIVYLEGNIKLLTEFLKTSQPDLQLIKPEGTYLAWIDFSAFMPDDKQRKDFINNKAKLWLDDGTMFGQEGSGFERINIACPRATLKQALDQLNQAMKSVQLP
jgi:cystathionine beta-lyase